MAGAASAWLVARARSRWAAAGTGRTALWVLLHLAVIVVLWVVSPRESGVPVALAAYAVTTIACGGRRPALARRT